MPKFSIVIPVYCVEDYLNACVQSVLSQTYRDIEVILVNDGSPDCSGQLCDEWALRDSRVKVVHKKNGGLSSARNRGMEEVSGEYVLFLDSDDYWPAEDILEEVAQRLQITTPDILVMNFQKEYDGKREPMYFTPGLTMPTNLQAEDSLGWLIDHGLWIATACNKVIRSQMLAEGQLRFREGITAEDIDWCLRLCLAVQKFDYLDVCLFIYRQRRTSITGSTTPEKTECLYHNIQECLTLLKKAEMSRQMMLRPFVSYQYGTLLYNIALLASVEKRAYLIDEAKQLVYMLHWSDNGKIRLIRIAYKVLGFRGMLWLLRQKARRN